MLFFLSIYVIGIIGFLIHVYKTPHEQRTQCRLIELFLLYQIVFSLGITSLVAFVGLTFLDAYIAQFTDWPSCPFEQQLANVNLGYGILGILCIWFRGYFWVATVIGFSIWIVGDGIHHLYHFFANDNASPGNIGVPLYTDILIPAVLLIFTWLYMRCLREEKKEK